MRRKIRRSVSIATRLLSFAGFVFSAVCTFVGIAPAGVVKSVLGPELVGHLLYFREGVLNMTAEHARWLLVFLGDLFFAVALYLLFYVRFSNKIAKIYVTHGEVEKTMSEANSELKSMEEKFTTRIAEHNTNVDAKMATAWEVLAKAAKRDRSARKIHGTTHKMLQKIRDARGDI